MLLLAAIPAAVYGKHDLMDVMTLLQIPGIAIVVLVISTWTSNTCNLYSATLTLATLFKRTSTRNLGLWGALVALVAAVAGIADYFIPLLIGLGIVSAPLAGVYVVDFFVLRERVYDASTVGQLPAIRYKRARRVALRIGCRSCGDVRGSCTHWNSSRGFDSHHSTGTCPDE